MSRPATAVDHDGALTTITMQFEPYNLLSTELMDGLLGGLEQAEQAGARAVLLRSGLKHFCAGADISMFDRAIAGGRLDISPVDFLHRVEAFPLPVVVAVNGVCVGGGLERPGLRLHPGGSDRQDRLRRGDPRAQPPDGCRATTGAARRCAAGQGDVDARPALRRRHAGTLEPRQPRCRRRPARRRRSHRRVGAGQRPHGRPPEASPVFTIDTYQHVLPGMQADAARVFEDLITNTVLPDASSTGLTRLNGRGRTRTSR